MVTKISIQNVTSYGNEPAILETNKRINLIYGLNGTGKTTISKYLQDRQNPIFHDCRIEGLGNEKMLVYNQKFIEDNFYINPYQKGIFSLASENKDAKEKIDKANAEIIRLNTLIKNDFFQSGLSFDFKKLQIDICNLQNTVEEKTWAVKSTYSGGDRVLTFCLVGLQGSKKDLFNHILNINKPINKPEKTIEELEKEAETTQGDNAQIYDENLIAKNNFKFEDIEGRNIFKEVIVGNEDSQIAEFITKLNNSNWIKEGKDYLHEPFEENEICPFCQHKTISKDFYYQIQKYFDETYNQKILELSNLYNEYEKEYQMVVDTKDYLLNIDFIKNKQIEFELLFNKLINKLISNKNKIKEKIKSPNISIDLESSISESDQLNTFLDTIIDEIRRHNEKINNKEITKNQIKKEFWEILRWQYDETIQAYKERYNILNGEKIQIQNQIDQIEQGIQVQNAIIQQEQNKVVSIQQAIKNINTELVFFGLEDFSIVDAGEEMYKLQRPGQDNAEFQSLSEGEKTVISFLYFLELCKGVESRGEVVAGKIVVVDDPISSLSHMYIFNVAHLIKKHFFNGEYNQVFILTHSLYLLHEFKKIIPKNLKKTVKSFRIRRKHDNYSEIITLEENEIMNDYQSYWQVIKDHNVFKASDSLLANAMRNILEYFFGFIDNEKYSNAIESLNEGRYTFFLRYINRESHYDQINISDIKEIDPAIFKEAFKNIFENSGFIDHYNKMIQD